MQFIIAAVLVTQLAAWERLQPWLPPSVWPTTYRIRTSRAQQNGDVAVNTGTGTVIAEDSRFSYLLTAKHIFIDTDGPCTVDDGRGLWCNGKYLAGSPKSDLALVACDRLGRGVVTLAEYQPQTAIVAGFGPLLHHSLPVAHKGSLQKRLEGGLCVYSLPIAEGYSGGGCYTLKGQLAGVATDRLAEAKEVAPGFSPAVVESAGNLREFLMRPVCLRQIGRLLFGQRSNSTILEYGQQPQLIQYAPRAQYRGLEGSAVLPGIAYEAGLPLASPQQQTIPVRPSPQLPSKSEPPLMPPVPLKSPTGAASTAWQIQNLGAAMQSLSIELRNLRGEVDSLKAHTARLTASAGVMPLPSGMGR